MWKRCQASSIGASFPPTANFQELWLLDRRNELHKWTVPRTPLSSKQTYKITFQFQGQMFFFCCFFFSQSKLHSASRLAAVCSSIELASSAAPTHPGPHNQPERSRRHDVAGGARQAPPLLSCPDQRLELEKRHGRLHRRHVRTARGRVRTRRRKPFIEAERLQRVRSLQKWQWRDSCMIAVVLICSVDSLSSLSSPQMDLFGCQNVGR